MNILPKKRWHVRTKDNIARVRRDEAAAAEEEKKKQLRIQIAEREARTQELRKKAREVFGTGNPVRSQSPTEKPVEAAFSPDKHVNLFYELEQNQAASNKTNEEAEKEKKLEREKYEKQIGYLTYLGQDTNELTGNVSWYNKAKEEVHDEKEEVSKKQKIFEDPLEGIRKYLGCEGIKKIKEEIKKEEKKEDKKSVKRKRTDSEKSDRHRKHKKSKKSKHKKKKHKRKHSKSETDESEKEVVVKKESSVNLERLRAERLRREREERRKAEELFARLNGVTIKKEEVAPEPVQKYNSQFNPHLAKQNYIN